MLTLTIGFGGVYPLLQFVAGKPGLYAVYTPVIVAVVGCALLTGISSVAARRGVPIDGSASGRDGDGGDWSRSSRRCSDIAACIRFGTRHWVWEGVQLALSIASSVSYIVYTYSSKRTGRGGCVWGMDGECACCVQCVGNKGVFCARVDVPVVVFVAVGMRARVLLCGLLYL